MSSPSLKNINKILLEVIQCAKPPEKISVSDYTEKYRMLDSTSSNYAGRWSNKITPWLVEPMNVMGSYDSTVHTVIKFGSQMGKTEGIINAIMHRMDIDPCPISMYLPSEKQAKDYSKTRITPALRNNKNLSKVVTQKSRDVDNTILSKSFPGGVLRLHGSNSPTDMAGFPIKMLCRDEINRWGEDVGGEGSGLSLTAQRTESFGDEAKIIDTSTPTTKGECAISELFEDSDQRHWYVPCPHCGEYQELLFRRILPGDDKETRMMHFERNEAGTVINAYMVCCHCGAIIEEKDKPAMQRAGKYISHNPGHAIAGFFANGLNSLFMDWKRVGTKFFEGTGNYLKLKSFVNVVLAQAWEDPTMYIKADSIQKRAEDYTEVPDEVLFITCAVDVQWDRLELEICGWGNMYERWGLEYKVIKGEYDSERTWEELETVLFTPLMRKDGRKQKIMTTFIDAHDGNTTTHVYKFCKRNQKKMVYATHGKGGSGLKPINNRAKDPKIGNIYLTLGVDSLKNAGAYALQIKEKGPGYCHFPKGNGFDKTYYDMLTAEEMITQKNKKTGKDESHWSLKKGVSRNEAWDVFGYNRAAIEYHTPSWSRWIEVGPRGIIEKPTIKRKNTQVNSFGGEQI